MVVRKSLVEAKEWRSGTSEAIRKHLPPGFDPTDFIHCTNGDMLLIWDDEKPFVPAPAVAPAVPVEVPKVDDEPIVPEVVNPIEENLVLTPDEPPAPTPAAVVIPQPRSTKKSKKK